jgi:hypothetical protein
VPTVVLELMTTLFSVKKSQHERKSQEQELPNTSIDSETTDDLGENEKKYRFLIFVGKV